MSDTTPNARRSPPFLSSPGMPPFVAALAILAFLIRNGFYLPAWSVTALGVASVMLAGLLVAVRAARWNAGLAGSSEAGGRLRGLLVYVGPLALMEGLYFGEARVASLIGAADMVILFEGILLLFYLPELHRRAKLTPAQTLFGGFLLLITLGTLLLLLPRAATRPLPFIEAFFHSVSAVCVTGLCRLDIAVDLTPLGQTVMLVLIQLGGLGIMTVALFVITAVGKSMGLRDYAIVSEMLPGQQKRPEQLLTRLISCTLLIELAGALALRALGFHRPLAQTSPDAVFAAFDAAFHAVSAFCNAGFGLDPQSLHGASRGVIAVHMVLIVLGGLGFIVLLELAAFGRRLAGGLARRQRTGDRPQWLSVHSKLVLATTAILLLAGTAVFLIVEWSNPKTLGAMSGADRLLNAGFQSVTTRTAGFSTVEQGSLREPSLWLTYALMCIGASPGSTGGGMKTMAVALAFLSALAIMRRRATVTVFGRTLPPGITLKVMALICVYGFTLWLATFLLMAVAGPAFRFRDLAFEAASAMGTVGLSTGITRDLPPLALLILCGAMFVGRLGPLAFILVWSHERRAPRVEYPEGEVHLG